MQVCNTSYVETQDKVMHFKILECKKEMNVYETIDRPGL